MGAADTSVAGYISAWQPCLASPEAAAFARVVVAAAVPHGRQRARNLLWAAGKPAGHRCPGPAPGFEVAAEALDVGTADTEQLLLVTRSTRRRTGADPGHRLRGSGRCTRSGTRPAPVARHC